MAKHMDHHYDRSISGAHSEVPQGHASFGAGFHHNEKHKAAGFNQKSGAACIAKAKGFEQMHSGRAPNNK